MVRARSTKGTLWIHKCCIGTKNNYGQCNLTEWINRVHSNLPKDKMISWKIGNSLKTEPSVGIMWKSLTLGRIIIKKKWLSLENNKWLKMLPLRWLKSSSYIFLISCMPLIEIQRTPSCWRLSKSSMTKRGTILRILERKFCPIVHWVSSTF